MSKMYFTLEESPYNQGKYMIRVNIHNLPITFTDGSYNVLPARIMNLSYADYLRMCRDLYDADIVGKQSFYPIAYFNKENEKARELVKVLNKRTDIILNKGV